MIRVSLHVSFETPLPMTPLHSTITEITAANLQQSINYVGKFTVIHPSAVRKFEILDLAIKYFNDLDVQAVIWDVTYDEVQLIKFKE